MKKFLTLLFMLFFCTSTPLFAESAPPAACTTSQSGCITVHIKGLKNPDGLIGVALYTTKNGFPDKPERAFATRIHKPGSTPNEATFDKIPYGTYAVSVLHDENGNGRMDKSFIGIPKEGFGVSNNPKIRRSPPSYNEALFTLNASQMELTVSMNYL
jgi:uncharacterized protein (DUF2141 family)